MCHFLTSLSGIVVKLYYTCYILICTAIKARSFYSFWSELMKYKQKRDSGCSPVKKSWYPRSAKCCCVQMCRAGSGMMMKDCFHLNPSLSVPRPPGSMEVGVRRSVGQNEVGALGTGQLLQYERASSHLQ